MPGSFPVLPVSLDRIHKRINAAAASPSTTWPSSRSFNLCLLPSFPQEGAPPRPSVAELAGRFKGSAPAPDAAGQETVSFNFCFTQHNLKTSTSAVLMGLKVTFGVIKGQLDLQTRQIGTIFRTLSQDGGWHHQRHFMSFKFRSPEVELSWEHVWRWRHWTVSVSCLVSFQQQFLKTGNELWVRFRQLLSETGSGSASLCDRQLVGLATCWGPLSSEVGLIILLTQWSETKQEDGLFLSPGSFYFKRTVYSSSSSSSFYQRWCWIKSK